MSANGSCWHKADIDLLELVRLARKADMARAIDCLAPTVDAHRSTGYLHRDPQKLYSQIIHASSLFLDSQISTPGRLPPSRTATIVQPSLLAEGVNRWRLLAEQGRRLRVRPSQSGLRGPRETPPGPTTWVRPATGWWSG